MNAPGAMMQCGAADFPVRRMRYLRFVELWEARGWVIKVYLQSAHRNELPRGYLAKAKTFIEAQLSEVERTQPLHRVGFMILSHGAVGNWIMLDWWSSLMLYHRIFRADGMPPEGFSDAPICFNASMRFVLPRLKAKRGGSMWSRIPAQTFRPTSRPD